MMRILSLLLTGILCLTARAQAPLVNDSNIQLQDLWLAETVSRFKPTPAKDGVEFSVGLLSISRHSTASWMPLVHGDGVGTVTLGQGLVMQGIWNRQGWELSATVTGLRDFDDHMTRGRLLEFGLINKTKTGWRWGLEKKPLQWGYGLFGGYLMGDAHDPVPRLVAESPSKDLSVFGVPLGTWGFDTFLGQLEWDREIPAWVSNPHYQSYLLATQGNLRRPNISGFRLRAAFGPLVDMNFGVISEWGGVDARGQNIMKGLSWWNYPLAYFGAENLAIAEASGNMSQDHPDPNQPAATPTSFHALSNALADVEVRIRFPETAAHVFGANALALHLSRGATSVNWHWKDFFKHPFSAWSHDLKFVEDRLGHHPTGSDPDSLWGWAYAQGSPSLAHINDTVGAQWIFDYWDLGIELSDLHNQPYPASTFRVYGHWRNLSGHSRYGDSLGQPLGGEIYQQGITLGVRLPREGRMRFQFLDAIRFYRDSPEQMDFTPGVDDHFFHTQVEAQWSRSFGRVGGSFAFERHQADLFIPGNCRSNWILSLGYAVPILKR